MAQVDLYRTKINRLGGLVIQNRMETCRSFSEFNTNTFMIVQDTEGLTQNQEADPQEISAIERGHRYYVTQVGEKRFRLESPYRISDHETAELGAGCIPEPDDESLVRKWGDSCRKWQAVRDKFFLTSASLELFRKRVEAIGGDFVMLHPDLEVLEAGWKQAVEIGAQAKDILERINTLKAGLTQENSPETLPRIQKLSKEGEHLSEAFSRAKDIFMGQNVRLMEGWGNVELKERSLKTCIPQIKEAEALVEKLKNEGPKLAIAAHLCLKDVRSKHKGGGSGRVEFETIQEALVSLRVFFPHFKFIRVDEEGDLLVEITGTDNYVKVTRSGVVVWRPEVKTTGGRIAFLEVGDR